MHQRKFLRKLHTDPTQDNGTIISLTSIPSRFHSLHLVIGSLLDQDVTPCPVHLWLEKEALDKLPGSVLELKERGLTIHECEDLRAYKKLVFALEQFPDHDIITVDDDLIYPPYWLRGLLESPSTERPCVSAYICREMKLGQAGENLAPYKEFKRISSDTPCLSHRLMSIGFAGVHYPAGALHSDATNASLFQRLCPHADDIWFKAMALRNNVPHRKIPASFGDEIYLPFTQKVSLKKTNVRTGGNDEQLKTVFDHFQLYNLLDES